MNSTISREDLLVLGREGDSAAFVNIATSALNQNPRDSEMRLLLVQHLAQWGLFDRAAQVCESLCDGAPAGSAEFADLVASLRQIRENGLVDHELSEQTFAANLSVARDRFEWTPKVETAWQNANLQLHRTRDGDFLAFDAAVGTEGRWRPVFGRLRAKATEQEIRAHVERRVVAPIAFDGIGLGSQLDVYYKATQDTMLGASPILYVGEASYLAVAAAMHLFDWRELLANARVVWCLGDKVYDQLEAALRSRPRAPIPQNIIVSPLWREDLPSRVQEILTLHRERMENEARDLRVKVEGLYRGRNSTWWAERYNAALAGTGRALRVMAITSRFTTVLQYSTRDAMDSLNAIGCETRTLIEADLQSYISTGEAMSNFLEFEPDLVFMIDHTRKTQCGENLIANVPLITWIQDRLPWLFDELSGQSMGSLDFCMGQSAEELVGKFNYPAERFMPCEMATHAAALAPDPARHDPAEYVCDVAYATHASEQPAEFHQKARDRATTDDDRRLIDAIYHSMRTLAANGDLNGSLYLHVLVDRCVLHANLSFTAEERSRFVAEFARPLSDRFLRHQTIQWAVNWARRTGRKLHLYGNGWDKHPAFAQFARGPLSHGWELGAAFRSAKVNLHAGCNPAMHQRVLDGLAAGGSFLIRKHGADISHRVARAIHEHLKQNNLRPPVAIRMENLPPSIRNEYTELRRYNGHDPSEPFIQTARHFEQYHCLFETKTVQLAGQIWPELDRIVFGSEQEFVARLDHFLAHANERRAIAATMRQAAIEKYSYESLMRRMLEWMVNQLHRQSAPSARFDPPNINREQSESFASLAK